MSLIEQDQDWRQRTVGWSAANELYAWHAGHSPRTVLLGREWYFLDQVRETIRKTVNVLRSGDPEAVRSFFSWSSCRQPFSPPLQHWWQLLTKLSWLTGVTTDEPAQLDEEQLLQPQRLEMMTSAVTAILVQLVEVMCTPFLGLAEEHQLRQGEKFADLVEAVKSIGNFGSERRIWR